MRRISTVEELGQALRAEILTGELMPGTRLLEKPLSERFGVSRNTLREAMQGLISRGLVDRNPHRGAAVSDPTAEEVREVYRVRRLLEPAGMRRLGASDVTTLDGLAGALDAAAEREDWPRVADLDIAFHLALIRGMESPRLEEFFLSLLESLRLVFISVDRIQSRHAPPDHVRQHGQIVRLLDAGKPDEASALLEEHLRVAEDLLMTRVEQRETEG